MASAVTRQTIRCKIQFESDMKAMKMKLNGVGFCRSRDF